MANILIIDDEHTIRNIVKRILQHEGHRLMEAENGRDGLKCIDREPVDLVITDLIMPEQEGLETIRILKKEHPEIRIIAISGGGRIEPGRYLNMAAKLGAGDTLKKPFSRTELLSAVKDQLALSKGSGDAISP